MTVRVGTARRAVLSRTSAARAASSRGGCGCSTGARRSPSCRSGGWTVAEAARQRPRPITKAQIRAIHTLKGQRGLDDDAYRDLLEGETGHRSSVHLNVREANRVLRALGIDRKPGKRATPGPKKKPEPLPPGVVRMATADQLRLIAELRSEIEWRHEDGYERWLRKNLGFDRVTASHHAVRVINGLLAMRRRQDG
ncbi:MAG: DUF1018 domain-containing protein [Holophagales bacterium]|nr:DUF1018 domain-containing protein [Holophagales bacterium]MYG30113.1 DUF1018 domain-containing protein [Holophagales bacterium]MYI78801.1 DUF1018 domain-containing protein [Holophagales bacterium]